MQQSLFLRKIDIHVDILFSLQKGCSKDFTYASIVLGISARSSESYTISWNQSM